MVACISLGWVVLIVFGVIGVIAVTFLVTFLIAADMFNPFKNL